jgi:hypothetical protein
MDKFEHQVFSVPFFFHCYFLFPNRTVRVSISTKEEFEDKRVKIGVLVVGEQAGLEKTRFFLNPAQWVFCFFWVFLGFFIYLPRRESF